MSFPRFTPGFVVASSVLLVFLACGGDSDTEVVAQDGDGGPDGRTSSSSGSSSGGASSSGTTSSASSGGSSGATDGGDAGDAAADGQVDSGPPIVGGSVTSIICGNVTCTLPIQVCCVSKGAGANGAFTFACQNGTTCTKGAGVDKVATLQCNAQANCVGGTSCCVSHTNGDATASCKLTCGTGEAELCDTSATDPGCPAGVACQGKDIKTWNLPGGFATCGGVAAP